jgi:hypothetical protein
MHQSHQLIRPIRRHLIITYAISLGFMTAYMSLLQPIPSASAQQLIGPVSQETSGTGTQGRRIENIATTLPYPTKSLEKKGAQTSPRKPHRLIRKPQNAPIATVEPSPSGSSPVNSLPTIPPSLQSDNTISQSKEPSSLNRSVGAALPFAIMSVAPSSATTTGSTCCCCCRHNTNRNHPAGRCRHRQVVFLRKRWCRRANDAKISGGHAGVGTIDLAALGPGTFSQSRDRNESDQSVLYSPARRSQSGCPDPDRQQHRRRNLELERSPMPPGWRSHLPLVRE